MSVIDRNVSDNSFQCLTILPNGEFSIKEKCPVHRAPHVVTLEPLSQFFSNNLCHLTWCCSYIQEKTAWKSDELFTSYKLINTNGASILYENMAASWFQVSMWRHTLRVSSGILLLRLAWHLYSLARLTSLQFIGSYIVQGPSGWFLKKKRWCPCWGASLCKFPLQLVFIKDLKVPVWGRQFLQ